MLASSISNLTTVALAQRIKAAAREIGFDLVGIAPAEISRYRDYFRRWLDEGRAGSMQYLANRFDERTDPQKYLPEAASVICVAMNYHVPLEELPAEDRNSAGRIARYALGSDYHELIKDRLHRLADAIHLLAPEAQTRACVDTAPVLERELAARAGIGWIGKNTCVIHPRVGSWIMLGEVITTVSLPSDSPIEDHCGGCTRCIDACPTAAITEPYRLDASRCISYLTIEHRGEIAESMQAKIGDWLFGCDICQDVCPHNRHAPTAIDEALRPRFKSGTLNVDQVEQWTTEEYQTRLKKSAIKRVKLPILKRNAAIVKKNLAEIQSSQH